MSSLNFYEQYPNSVQEMPALRENVAEIAREILQIVIVQKGKTIKDINKIFQATLSNYFFECYVCGLIASHSRSSAESKRTVKRRVDSRLNRMLRASENLRTLAEQAAAMAGDAANAASRKRRLIALDSNDTNNPLLRTPKYIYLIQAYSDEILALNLTKEYIDMLTDTITTPTETTASSTYDLTSESAKKHATAYQKKLCALFVLEFHLQHYAIAMSAAANSKASNLTTTTTSNEQSQQIQPAESLTHSQQSQQQQQQQPQQKFRNFTEIWNSVFKHFPINYFARERNIVSGKVQAINSQQAAQKSGSKQATIKHIEQRSPVTSYESFPALFTVIATQNNISTNESIEITENPLRKQRKLMQSAEISFTIIHSPNLSKQPSSSSSSSSSSISGSPSNKSKANSQSKKSSKSSALNSQSILVSECRVYSNENNQKRSNHSSNSNICSDAMLDESSSFESSPKSNRSSMRSNQDMGYNSIGGGCYEQKSASYRSISLANFSPINVNVVQIVTQIASNPSSFHTLE